MGFSSFSCITQAPSQRTSVGQTRPQLCPRILASRITRAEPRRLSVVIFFMKDGTSMCVGHAIVQGASKQKRQRAASTAAWSGVIRGEISAKFFSYCSDESLVAVSRSVMNLPSFPWLEKRRHSSIRDWEQGQRIREEVENWTTRRSVGPSRPDPFLSAE